jgi:hypothetical protein
MYRIHITAEPQELGADPSYKVAVMLPGQSSAPTAAINEHNLQVVLYEILPTASAATVREHLRKAHTRDGDLIELPHLSEEHFNMLRGLPPAAVRR